MTHIKAKNIKMKEIKFSELNNYSISKKDGGINMFYDYDDNNNTKSKILKFQTPRLLSLFGLNVYKNTNGDISSVTITLQFNSLSDKINRVDNFLKKIIALDKIVKLNASNNHKSWLSLKRKPPKDHLEALYKKSLYYKTQPDGEIDYSVPPTFKVKLPYNKNTKTFNFSLLNENGENIEYTLEDLEKLIVDKCIIKCVIRPSIYIFPSPNFGITYNVEGLQVFENKSDITNKGKKKSKKDVKVADIKNFFSAKKESDDDSDNSDESDNDEKSNNVDSSDDE